MLFQEFAVKKNCYQAPIERRVCMESKEKLKKVEKCLDSQLWHACAGGMVQMPQVNTKVFYFPQGHAEHACEPVNFRAYPKIPPLIQCRVAAIKYMADPETDEVYAKLRLIPLPDNEADFEDECVGIGNISGSETKEKPPSFAKTLTQSDANNGGGFSVPRYCAETIFPRLDYSADPPVQNILAKDVHGETWKFRHIYRGTPRRHLLTTGWSTFVNHKKLVAGDSIVFLRAENGDLCVGIRRAKRGNFGGTDPSSSGWNPGGGIHRLPYGGFTSFLGEGDNQFMGNGNSNGNGNGNGNGLSLSARGKVRAQDVIEAATLGANMKPFEVVYYPRSSTPEFCVKTSLVRAALQIRWCPGMRFKMPFETEDSSRISWFMGTIASVHAADPTWPNSPWRLLQVTWDEPELLQNVKRVSPWLVELASNVPSIHLSPFAPPRKKLRLPQQTDFPFDGQISVPAFSNNLLGLNNLFGRLPESSPAGMQGARHAHYGLSLSDLHLNKLQSGLFQASFPQFDHASTPMRIPNYTSLQKTSTNETENVSCLLSIASSTQSSKKPDDLKAPQLVLFGQTILTEQQISLSTSGNSSCDGNGNADKMINTCDGHKNQHQENLDSLETGHCKIFMESEDVGRTMDLSLLQSYDELHGKLADMFGKQKSEVLSHVLYRDITGAVKHIGDEAFSDFTKTARRLTILMDASSDASHATMEECSGRKETIV